MQRSKLLALLSALAVAASTAAVGGAATGVTNSTNRTATIGSCTIISSPGTYALGGDITANRSGCIRIEASDVVLDGNGHTIDGDGEEYREAVVASSAGGLTNVTVRNLAVTAVERDGIRYENVVGGTVTNVSVSVAERGLTLQNSSDVSVTQNSFTEIGLTSIDVRSSNDNRIARNTFAKTKFGTAGVDLVDSNGNEITENTATALEGGLLDGTNASRNVVTENTVTEKGSISLEGDDNRIAHNTLKGEADIGVSGSNNVVVNNTAADGVGVSGTSNTVVRNEIDSGDQYNDEFGLSISGSGHRIVENTISGGGRDSDEGAAVSIEGGNHTLARNELGGPSGVVVQAATDTITIRNNDIGYFKNGVHIEDPELCGDAGAEVVEIHRNSFDGREGGYYSPDTVYGILNEDDEVVNATGNYWDDPSGPSSPGNVNGTLSDPVTGAPANGNDAADAVSEGPESGVSNVHFYPYLPAPPQDDNENTTTA